MRSCKNCRAELPDDEFQMRQKRYFRSNCRSCESALRLARGPSKRSEAARNRRNVKTSTYYKLKRKDPAMKALFLYKDAKASDRKTGRCFDLTIEFISAAIASGCAYCGDNAVCMMSLDRIDNSLGHVKTNVVSACCRCNLVRGDMPYEAWMRIAPAMRVAFQEGIFGDWYPKRRGQKFGVYQQQGAALDC